MTKDYICIRDNDFIPLYGSGMFFDTRGISNSVRTRKMEQYLKFINTLEMTYDFIDKFSIGINFGYSESGRIMIHIDINIDYIRFFAFGLDASENWKMVDEFAHMTGLNEYHVPDDVFVEDHENVIDAGIIILEKCKETII